MLRVLYLLESESTLLAVCIIAVLASYKLPQ